MNLKFLKNKIILLIKCSIYLFIDFFISLTFIIFSKTKVSNKILLTRIDHLGDFICSIEFLNKTIDEFKKKDKNVKIIFLCNNYLEEFIKSLNIFDEIIAVDVNKIFFAENMDKINFTLKNIIYRIKTIWFLKKTKYKMIIHLNDKYTTHFLIKNLFSGKKFSFFCSKNIITKFLKNFYTKFFYVKERNEMKKLNIFYNEIFKKNIFLDFPKLRLENINFTKKDFLNEKNYCIFGLGSMEIARNWDIKNFVNIAKYLINKKIFVLLIGSKNEKNLGNDFLSFMNNLEKNYIINLIDKTSILDLCNLIKYSKFVFGNDSGYIHVANALNVISIALVPGNNWGTFLPYKINKIKNISPICLSQKNKCKNYPNCQNNYCDQISSKNDTFWCIKNIKKADILNEINKIV